VRQGKTGCINLRFSIKKKNAKKKMIIKTDLYYRKLPDLNEIQVEKKDYTQKTDLNNVFFLFFKK
jgi:hypothetical protein